MAGCSSSASGTGRMAVPAARAGAGSSGSIGRPRCSRGPARREATARGSATLVRGDIRDLPFRRRPGFALVMAPYGILQSLTREKGSGGRRWRPCTASCAAAAKFGIDLVPDLPALVRVQPPGKPARPARQDTRRRSIESVRQDRRGG